MTGTLILQSALAGITNGLVYALTGVGIAVVFRGTRIINAIYSRIWLHGHVVQQRLANHFTHVSYYAVVSYESPINYCVPKKKNAKCMKVIGCSSLRGGGSELGTNKNLDLWLQLVCTKHKLKHTI